MSELPLEGIRVCDLTWVIAGPVATRVLGDFGAEILKIEHEQAVDPVRMGRPTVGGPPNLNNSGFFNYINRNKLSVLLNVRHPMGMDVLKRIIAESDVVIENFSSEVLESWDLGYEQLREIREDIIYCSVSGFGHSGRDHFYTTWGPTAQALAGLTAMSGMPGKPPAGWGYSYMDHTAGYYAAYAVMMALYHRNKTGEGQHIDISQAEAGMVLTGPAVLDYTVNGRSWRREGMPPGNHAWEPSAAPHNVYRCEGEDRWIAIAVMSDAEWQALVRAMDEPEWAAESRYDTLEGRLGDERLIDEKIEAWTSENDRYRLMELLQAAGVRASVVQNPEDRVEHDPQSQARGWWGSMEHEQLGVHTHDGVNPRLSKTPGEARIPSPMIGQHTSEVMSRVIGMSEAEIAEHQEIGVFM